VPCWGAMRQIWAASVATGARKATGGMRML
jgi:hypothetical protein